VPGSRTPVAPLPAEYHPLHEGETMKHSRFARLLISTIGPALLVLLVLALPTLATPATQSAPARSASIRVSPSITITKTDEVGIMSQPLAPDALPRDLTVVLAASGKIEPGRKFSYAISFNNAGSTAADKVVITNTLPAGVILQSIDSCTISPTVNGQQLVWQLGNIPPGGNGTLYLSVQLTSTAAIGSQLMDVAQITGSGGDDNPANNQATNVLAVTAPARDLAVSKSMGGTPFVGATTQYVINYANQGSLTVTNLIITDVLPVNVTYLSYGGDPEAHVVLTGSVLVFTRALLAGDASSALVVDVKIADSVQPGNVLTNVVRATTTDPEISLANNVYTNTTTIVAPTRDLNVSKLVTGGSFQAGEQIEYEIRFENDGNYTATNTILTDTLPTHTTWITWTGYMYNPAAIDLRTAVTPTFVGNQVIWNVGALGPGAYGYLYPVIQIDGGAPNLAVLTNQASISTNDPETFYNNNSSSATGVVTPYGGPDASGYRFKDETMPGGPTFNWLDATDGTRSFVFGDDRSAGPTPLGFDFFFYGRNYTTTYLVTNGYLAVGGSDTAYSNRNIPNPAVPNNFIAPFWDDLQVCPNQANQAIYFKQGGSAPNRYFAAEWAGVSRLSAPTRPITFETVLYENGEILFQYQSLTGTLNSASVGIESYEGLRGLEYEFNQNKLANGRAILFTPRILKAYLPVIYR
jgi:uncharacterized repeat protein (TIGR01451 family)